MKYIVSFLVVMASMFLNNNLLYAQTVTADTVQAPTDSPLTLRSTVGTNLVGGSIQIEATGYGTFTMSTENQNDIDVDASGNVVLWPQTEGYQVIMYGDSALVQTQYGLQLQPYDVQPSCDSSRRGLHYYANGDIGVADEEYTCKKNDDDTFTWHLNP